jgi:Raf kinase inhibitor-like YbhB/YbcL family protein/uncharacterized protein (TIGR00297 family)
MTLPLTIQIPLGVLLALLVALAAYRVRALNRTGALAAALLGAVIFGLGGLPWAIVLLGFFISSSALSRLFGRRKARFDEKFSKGSRRDAGQVLANGGVAGLAALGAFLANGHPWLSYTLWLAFCASLAAANADTWATELGVISRRPPVLITSGKTVETGASGGISAAGTLAALAGSALIALIGLVLDLSGGLPFTSAHPIDWLMRLAPYGLVLLAGLFGSLVDSALGATLQAIYTCPTCAKETERHPLHTCGTPTRLVRGWRWLNNDWVNSFCTLSAGLMALGVGLALAPASSINPISTQNAPAGMLSPTSQAFANGGGIPSVYTCSGDNRSPDLAWSGLPAGTTSLALIADDPDAPMGPFTHWVTYNLAPSLPGLPAGQPQTAQIDGIGSQGKNSFGHSGYDGPCPPAGKVHHYHFRLYATNLPAGSLPPDLTAADLRKALLGHILASGEWVGTFEVIS